MMKDRSLSSKLFDFILFVMCAVVLVSIIAPILNIFSVSFSSYDAFARGDVTFWPVEFSLDAYKAIIRDGKVLQGLKYSVLYTALGTLINVILTILTAYPLSRPEMPFRKTISMFFAFTMFFSGGTIPTFLLVQKLGLYNTIWAMVIPNAMQVYNMIIMRTFFQSIPFELTEAARLDGANDFKILWDVILPLSKASIATIALFYAVMHWNSWFQASIYFSSSDMAPLQLVLRNMVINAETLVKSGEASNIGSTSINYATLFISMLPMMALYPFIQKYFVKGVMVGSVKG